MLCFEGRASRRKEDLKLETGPKLDQMIKKMLRQHTIDDEKSEPIVTITTGEIALAVKPPENKINRQLRSRPVERGNLAHLRSNKDIYGRFEEPDVFVPTQTVFPEDLERARSSLGESGENEKSKKKKRKKKERKKKKMRSMESRSSKSSSFRSRTKGSRGSSSDGEADGNSEEQLGSKTKEMSEENTTQQRQLLNASNNVKRSSLADKLEKEAKRKARKVSNDRGVDDSTSGRQSVEKSVVESRRSKGRRDSEKEKRSAKRHSVSSTKSSSTLNTNGSTLLGLFSHHSWFQQSDTRSSKSSSKYEGSNTSEETSDGETREGSLPPFQRRPS